MNADTHSAAEPQPIIRPDSFDRGSRLTVAERDQGVRPTADHTPEIFAAREDVEH
jgi:hypothetical protein